MSDSWIGLFDLNQNANNRFWRWADFTPVAYANWQSGQPDDNDYCAQQSGGTKLWWGKVCTEVHKFWCEAPQVNVVCPSGFTIMSDGMCYSAVSLEGVVRCPCLGLAMHAADVAIADSLVVL